MSNRVAPSPAGANGEDSVVKAVIEEALKDPMRAALDALRASRSRRRLEQRARQEALGHWSFTFKLLLFFAINASLMVWVFVLARLTSRYVAVEQASGDISTTYTTKLVKSSTQVRLSVNDYYVPQPGAVSAKSITFLIHLPQDAVGDPGWNLQDLTNSTRTFDQSLAYFNVTTGKRMIQNYRRCRTRCLTGDLPADFVAQARNYSATAYGFSAFDFYLDRDWFISTVDPDFFAAYHSPDISSVVREAYSRWGQTATSNDVGLTKPTDSKYVCNLGSPRRRLTAIVIKTSACHVQITSHAGGDYSMLVRGREGRLSVPSISETVTSNSTSGCQTFELTIDVRGSSCPTSSVPGIKPSCEDICALVLQKGDSARRLPIKVVADVDAAVDPSVLYIDDRFLVLDSRHPWNKAPSTTPDLSVLGGSIVVDLRYARIGNLLLQAGAGRKAASFLSVDTLYVNSTFDDDVVLEDNRNSLLMYRNPDNLVCAAAPLVEQIPQDFLECDALEPGSEVHMFYEVSADDVIDKREFLLGLSRLGISFEAMGFTEQEQQAVLDHVFNAPDPTQQLQDLPLREVIQRLFNLMPPLLTLYDTGDDVELSTVTSRSVCNANCLAAGNNTQYCNAACVWRCNGASLNISEPSYGLCDPSAGCSKTCGVPDWPITRYSSVLTGVSQLRTEIFDVDANGLMGVEELRSLLLRLHSNCTYKVLQTDVRVSTAARYCAVQGEGQYTPGVVESYTALYLNCNYTNGNSDDWRINNLQAVPGVSPAQYGSTRLPRECRPFPDYDPRLSGRQYDPSAKRSRCPECFLLDGTRVPPQYYNRSTWSRERYEEVMKYVRQVLTPRDVAGAYVPYFNISDDTQFSIFASKLLAAEKKADTVDYSTFNLNIQTLKNLDFLRQKYLLFNPWCFNGLFLKTKPDYVNGNQDVNQASIVAASMRHSDTGSNLILSSNMPGYNMSTSPSAKGTLPCSTEWGNGTQASTNFTYFAWANSSIGYKWGKALPEFCMDERWPDGGVGGRYPDDWSVYGSLAGKRIVPGCEIKTCLPRYWVDNGFGSIHAQVLPFTGLPEPPGVDWWNETGSYRRMVDNCEGQDGIRKCFYQGYSNDVADRFSPAVLPSYRAAMQPCVDQSADCSDQLVVLSVTGEGVPTHQKWFWVSRKVYMEVEPPYFFVMSAGTLSPDVMHLKMRMSPGFCSVAHGAVEAIDWRDSRLVGSNADTRQALRTERNAAIYRALVAALPAPISGSGMSRNAGWYLKQVWRDPYTNESLYMDPATADALRDTAPGYMDHHTGQQLGVGAFWRHRRACYGTGNCSSQFFTYRDNCLVPRVAMLNASNASWYLSPCSYPNGSSAYLDPLQAEQGGTFNEIAYSNQFAMNITDYKWYDHVEGMSPDDHLSRNYNLYTQGYSADNVTVYAYTKLSVSFNELHSVQFHDASNGASTNTALLVALIFSILVAAFCGLGALTVIIIFGYRQLCMMNNSQEMQLRVRQRRVEDRHERLFNAIYVKRTEFLPKHRTSSKVKAKKEAAAADATKAEQKKDAASSKVEAVEEAKPWPEDDERKEILHVMALHDFTDKNVHRWNLRDMANIWRDEVIRRAPTLNLKEAPEDRCKLLEENRLPSDDQVKTERKEEMLPPPKKEDEEDRERRILMSGNFLQRGWYTFVTWMRQFGLFMATICSYKFPSPFKVLDQVVVNEVRIRLFNSLQTFIKVKCKVNHHMRNGEVIVLGMLNSCEKGQAARQAAKVANSVEVDAQTTILNQGPILCSAWIEMAGSALQSAMNFKEAEDAEEGMQGDGEQAGVAGPEAGIDEDDESQGAGGATEEGQFRSENTAEDDNELLFEIDGTGEGAVCVNSDDFRKELYTVQSVHISVHRIRLGMPSQVFSRVHKMIWLMRLPGFIRLLLQPLITDMRNLFTFCHKTWTCTVDSPDNLAYVVVVQEGAGCVVNKGYDRKKDEEACGGQVSRDDHMCSTSSDTGDFWVSRTLVLPCPGLPTADGRPIKGVSRTYKINEDNGPSFVTINTAPSELLGDHKPIVEFHTTRRGFNTIYERWCAQNGLNMRDVLGEEERLAGVDIQIKKRVVPRVKGLRLLKSTLTAKVELHTQQHQVADKVLFECGEDRQFSIKAADVGTMQSLRVRSSGEGFCAPWRPKYVSLCSSATGHYMVFTCDSWLNKEHGLVKDIDCGWGDYYTMDAAKLFAGTSAGVSTTYTVIIDSLGVPDDGNNVRISIQLFGDQAYTPPTPLDLRKVEPRQRKSTHRIDTTESSGGKVVETWVITQPQIKEKFMVHGPNVGRLRRIAISGSVDSDGSASEDKAQFVWHLNEVEVHQPGLRRPHVFKCDKTLTAGSGSRGSSAGSSRGSSRDSSLFRHECSVEGGGSRRSEESTYKVLVRTSDEEGAGTDSKVWITISGDKGETAELELKLENAEEVTNAEWVSLKDYLHNCTSHPYTWPLEGPGSVKALGQSLLTPQECARRRADKKKLHTIRDAVTNQDTHWRHKAVTSVKPKEVDASGMSRLDSEFGGPEGLRTQATGVTEVEVDNDLTKSDPKRHPVGFEALRNSNEHFARFLCQECDLTANFASHWVDLEALQFRYNMWQAHQRIQGDACRAAQDASRAKAAPASADQSQSSSESESVVSSVGSGGSGKQLRAGSGGGEGQLQDSSSSALSPSPSSAEILALPFHEPQQPTTGSGAAALNGGDELPRSRGSAGSGSGKARVSSAALRSGGNGADGLQLDPVIEELIRLTGEGAADLGSSAKGSASTRSLGSSATRGREDSSAVGGRGGGSAADAPRPVAEGTEERQSSAARASSRQSQRGLEGRSSASIRAAERLALAALQRPRASQRQPAALGSSSGKAKAPVLLLEAPKHQGMDDAPTPAAAAVTAPALEADDIITPDAVKRYGLKHADEEVCELVGVMVDLKELFDDPDDVNRFLTLALDAITVTLHTAFIWVLALPLVLTFVAFQQVYEDTTAVEHLLTIDAIRLDPAFIGKLYFFDFLKDILIFALTWIMFCYMFLVMHYVLGPDGRDYKWHVFLRYIFWLFLTVMVAILVAYAFEIITWIILGAVINPNKYLPYSVAIVTLLVHTHATYMRLKQEFAAFKDKVVQVVKDAFAQKLRAAIEVAKKAVGSVASTAGQWQADVMNSGAVQGGMDAVAAFSNYPGAPGLANGGAGRGGFLDTIARMPGAPGPKGTDPAQGGSWSSKFANMLRSRSRRGFQAVATEDDYSYGIGPGQAEPQGAQGAQGAQQGASWAAQGAAGIQAAAPYLPQQYQQYWAQAPGALNAATAAYAHMPSGAMPPQAAAAMAYMASLLPGGAPGEAMNPYEVFKRYAKEDDSLDYAGFGRLLDHLEIKLIGDRRHELFVHFASAERDTMGYKEFEACYALIKENIVDKTLAAYGMTRGRFIFMLCYFVFILLLLFVFIFVGVAAFTGAGTLGAIVNSLLAAGAGIALNLKKKDEAEESAAVTVKIGDQEYTGGGGSKTTVTTAA